MCFTDLQKSDIKGNLVCINNIFFTCTDQCEISVRARG